MAEFDEKSSVYPSGAERITSIAAIEPEAPGLLSMTKGCPSATLSCCPTIRAARSVAVPGGKGTIILTGRLG